MVGKSYSGFPKIGLAAICRKRGPGRIRTWRRAAKLRKASQRRGPAPPCGVALDSALYPVEQRPQFARVDVVRSHKVTNDRIGQQLVD
jgi:hypothetical protein